MGLGALIAGTAFLLLLAAGLARSGAMRGDHFPGRLDPAGGRHDRAVRLLPRRPRAAGSARSIPKAASRFRRMIDRLTVADIWSLTCCRQRQPLRRVLEQPVACGRLPASPRRCSASAFALLHRRTGFRAKGLLRLLAILPIITPPFVIGLGIILLFGRSGVATVDDQRPVRHPAEPLDLWLRRAAAGADAGLHADRLSGADRRGRWHQPLDGGSGADPARRPLAHLPHRDLAAAAARASPTPSSSASSRAWPISAIRWCSAATSTCCRPTSSSPSSARRTIPAAPPPCRSSCWA